MPLFIRRHVCATHSSGRRTASSSSLFVRALMSFLIVLHGFFFCNDHITATDLSFPVATPSYSPLSFNFDIYGPASAMHSFFAHFVPLASSSQPLLQTIPSVITNVFSPFFSSPHSFFSSPSLSDGRVPSSFLPFLTLAMATSVPASPSNSNGRSAVMAIGYLRMAGIDDASVLAALYATIAHANKVDLVKGVTFTANVTSIPCDSYAACTDLSAEGDARYIQPFLAAMGNFTAIFKPNYLLAPRVIDRAREVGGVPVIEPASVRARDFTSAEGGLPSSDHVIHFAQYITSELVHIFTFMHSTDGCALSGIMYENFSEIPNHVVFTRRLFVDGGMADPPAIALDRVTEDQLFDYLAANPYRHCFMLIATHGGLVKLGQVLATDRFVAAAAEGTIPKALHLYGISMVGGTSYGVPLADGTTTLAPFAYLHYVRWAPSYSPKPDGYTSTTESQYFLACEQIADVLADWVNSTADGSADDGAITMNFSIGADGAPVVQGVDYTVAIPAREAAAFINGVDLVPAVPDDGALDGYLIIMFILDTIRVAVAAHHGLLDADAVVPLPWAALTSGFYGYPRIIGNFPFDRMRRTCPPKPMAQDCFCNTATLTSFIFRVNTSAPNGKPYAVFDDEEKGQRGVASNEFVGTCEITVSSRSFPITVLSFDVTPEYNVSVNGGDAVTLRDRLEKQAMVAASFQDRVRTANLAPVAPARPYRYVSAVINDSHTTTAMAMPTVNAQYAPFIIVGSSEGAIEQSDVLTLLPSLLHQQLEDPVLVNHSEWQSNIINLIPVLADYIHALASFYSENRDDFTAFYALASTFAEAQLVSKSLATFGFDVPVSAITIGSEDGSVWERRLGAILSSAAASAATATPSKPFILACTASSGNDLAALLRAAAHYSSISAGKGIALAAPARLLNAHYTDVEMQGEADILFTASISDWWLPSKHAGLSEEHKRLAVDPLYWYTQAAADITTQLAQRAQFTYDANAAQLAYEISVFSSGGNSYGPISNRTCTDRQIATNDRTRECQCTKGPRTMYLLSLQSWQRHLPSVVSNHTGGYSYYLASCGVVYAPYVPPPADNSLSSGAIAGIAVGGSVFFIGFLITFFVINALCFGRNNRHAPADSTKPFTIVFTDIQSSTALWSRCPSAMSEAVEQHHSIIRSVIRKHSGYEVKTIGDSFMIAFKDPNNAVKFSVALQTAFFEGDWNSEIDAVYTELILEAEAAAEHAGIGATAAAHQNRRAAAHSYQQQNTIDSDRNTLSNINNNAVQSFSNANNLNTITMVSHDVSNSNIIVIAAPTVADGGSLSAASSVQHYHRNRQNSVQSGCVSSICPAVSSSLQQQQQQHTLHSHCGVPRATSHQLFDDQQSYPSGDERPALGTSTGDNAFSTANGNNRSYMPGDGFEDVNKVSQPNPSRLPGDIRVLLEAPQSTSSQTNQSVTITAGGNGSLGPAWHGIRVRVGVNYGMGEARKDPVTHGYDYYGTVVNTAARVEGVGHGGQILLTNTVMDVLEPQLLSRLGTVVVALGPQPLRGLDAPIQLTQIVPTALSARRFPPLRLHIEVDVTEDTTNTESGTGTGNGSQSNMSTLSYAELANQLCGTKQFNGLVTSEELLLNLVVLTTVMGPTKTKWQHDVYTGLGEAWGFEKAGKAVRGGEGSRTRLLVTLMGKVTKAINMNQSAKPNHNANVGMGAAARGLLDATRNSQRRQGTRGSRSAASNTNSQVNTNTLFSNNNNQNSQHRGVLSLSSEAKGATNTGGGVRSLSGHAADNTHTAHHQQHYHNQQHHHAGGDDPQRGSPSPATQHNNQHHPSSINNGITSRNVLPSSAQVNTSHPPQYHHTHPLSSSPPMQPQHNQQDAIGFIRAVTDAPHHAAMLSSSSVVSASLGSMQL